MIAMSNLDLERELVQSSRSISVTDPMNLSSTTKNIDPTATDYLIAQCENLWEDNVSTYIKCIEQQEKLGSNLTKTNEDYKYMGSLLENASKDRLTIKSNHGHLTEIYEILLKNNFVNDFVDHGSSIERVNSKFLISKEHIRDFRSSLNVIDGDLTTLKSEFKELHRDVLLHAISSKKFLGYAERGKILRLKSGNVMHKCEDLNACLNEAYQEIMKLNSEYDELTRNYKVLSQNAVVKEFLDCAKYQEKIMLDSDKKVIRGCSESSVVQTDNPDAEFSCLPLDEHEKILDTELQQQDKIEKKNCSLDKSYHALHEYQSLILADNAMEEYGVNKKSMQKSSEPINLILSDTSVVENTTDSIWGIGDSKLIEKVGEEAVFDDDDFHLHISSSEEDDFMPANETIENSDSLSVCCTRSEFDNYNSSVENLDLTEFSQSITDVADDFIEDSSRNVKLDPIAKNELSSSSNWAESRSTASRKLLPMTKVSYDSELQRSPTISSSTVSNNTIEESHGQIENEQLCCSICQKPIELKKNDPLSKSPTCSICNNTIDPVERETKSAIDDPTSQITNNDSTVENSSKLHAVSMNFQCNICDRYFAWRKTLRNHKRSIHEVHEDLKCPVCKKIFNNIYCVQRHALIHTSLCPYKCSYCHKSYNSPSPLSHHIREVHGVDLNTLKKDQKKVQIVRNILKINLRTMKKMYTDGSSSKYNLQSIRKVHSSVKNEVTNFQCNICDRYYPNKQSLRGHKRSIHEGHEDYICPICDKIFISKRNMHRHTLTHSSLRPYKCSVCDKSYGHPSSLQYHMDKVHGVDVKTLRKDRKELQIARNIVEENVRNIYTDRKNSIKMDHSKQKSRVNGATNFQCDIFE